MTDKGITDAEYLVKDLKFIAADKRHNKSVLYYIQQAIETIERLQKQMLTKGKWIVDVGKADTIARCSVCGESFYYYNKGQYHIDKSSFCPNCGADMRKDGAE